MSAAKHTPGPWSTEVLGGTIRVVSGAEEVDGRVVGDDVVVVGGCNDARSRANAALIASAPDLLAAVNGLCEAYDLYEGSCDCGECPQCPSGRALAAIAKAKGGAA